MRAYEVKVIHKSDWTYKLFGSGVDLHTIHAEVSSRGIDECVVIDLLKIRRSDANAFSKTFQAIKSNWRVISCQLVAGTGGEMLVLVVSKCQESVRFILNSHKIPVVRSMVRNGVEIYTVLAQDKHHIGYAAKEIQSISEIIDIRQIALGEALLYTPTEKINVPKLTKREKEILGTALREGFFEHPKRIKIENIARIHGVSKAYVSVTIRKAVRKALEWLVETGF
jgi:predicted DNA binding protein